MVEEQGQPPMVVTNECPSVPVIVLMATPNTEPSTGFTANDSDLPDQAWPVVVIRAPTVRLPVVGEPSRTMAKTKPSLKRSGIEQIFMMVEQLLETTCKWKEEHDEEAEQS